MQFTDELVSIAENDAQRSNYVRKLVQETDLVSSLKTSARIDIPKILVQYWHDLNEIPKDVQRCFDSWESLKRQGLQIELYDDDRASFFISEELGQTYVSAFHRCHHPAMRCDYFRLCFILIKGGFYVDADEVYQGRDCSYLFFDNMLKLQPLCYDVATDKMINIKTFACNRKYSKNWIFYFNNNPIIAPPNHPVINLAIDRATRILLSSNERPEIQSTTGPGNMTASIVHHALMSRNSGKSRDFAILKDWESITISPWQLSYRSDERNWRLWNP